MMPLIQWKDAHSVQIEKLDEHHKHFVGIVNRLYESMMRTEDIGSVQPIINELFDYSSYHFTAEEQFMRDSGYRELDEHIAKHRYFMEKIKELQEIKLENQLTLARELIVFLGGWLLHHILEVDKRYSGA